jgi:hypothetical protein
MQTQNDIQNSPTTDTNITGISLLQDQTTYIK